MKALLSIIILGFLGSCSQEKAIKRIEIKKVDFEITSIIGISCDGFEKYFQKEIKTIVISDQKRIDSFRKIVDGLKLDQEKYVPDVRAKIFVQYTGAKTDTICLSNIGILLNGKSYLIDESLVNFVRDSENK